MPLCTLTTDTCDAGTCFCGTANECGTDTLSNRCLDSVCVCGVSASCTSGTRYATCLDQLGNTPGSSNTVATCKVGNFILYQIWEGNCQISKELITYSQTLYSFQCATDTECRTATGAETAKPFCGNLASALGANVVPVGVCGQCQTVAGGGGGPSDCTSTGGTCAQGTCQIGELCCASGACEMFESDC